MIGQLALCGFDGAHWLLFGPNVPPLIYYSHIPNIIISIFLAFYILFKNKKGLSNKVLFYTILAFESWVFFALVFWATNRSDVVMFSWLMDILVEPLVYIGCLYLLYLIIDKKDISFGKKVLLGILYLPIPIFLPTALMLSGFDVGTCLATEGPLALYYTYFVEILVTLWVIIFCVRRYFTTKEMDRKKEILYLSIGTILLLFAFGWGNIIGSFSDNWELGDYGLFGMPIFIAFLVYTIVKFKEFNMKLLGTQALLVAQGVIIGSLLFIENIDYLRIIISLSLIIFLILGIVVIRGVKREVSLREELQEANQGQANLMHFMNHQIKGRLGNAKNVFAELLTNDYGQMPEDAKPLLQKGLEETDIGINYVTSILKGASAESGKLPYDMKPMNFQSVVEAVIEKEKGFAETKGLAFHARINSGEYHITGDTLQLREAVKNLIDNSINYTPQGSIDVTLSEKAGVIRFEVKDTGVGISPEDKPKLFKSGGRGAESLKVNVNATGYGLVFVKGVIEAHKGRVWVESDGRGKGSTFILELPKTNP